MISGLVKSSFFRVFSENVPNWSRGLLNADHRLPLAGLILIGMGLRLYDLSAKSIWHDEAYTAMVSEYDWQTLFFIPFDVNPPFFYILVKLFTSFGVNEFSLRLPSVLAGVALIPVVWAIGKTVHTRLAGLLAAALVATHPFLIDYSQEARAYSLVVLMMALSCLGLLRAFSNDPDGAEDSMRAVPALSNRQWLFIYAAAAILGLYTHLIAAFYLTMLNSAIIAWFLLFNRDWRSPKLRDWIVANTLIAAMFLPWLLSIPNVSENFQWLRQASFDKFF